MNDSRAPDPALAGRRVLVVEDTLLVSIEVQAALTRLGCLIAGAPARLPDALSALDDGPIDAVLLDLNINGEPSYPVAEALMQRGIPFVFMTGYQAESLEPEFQAFPCLTKPFGTDDLRRALASLLGSA